MIFYILIKYTENKIEYIMPFMNYDKAKYIALAMFSRDFEQTNPRFRIPDNEIIKTFDKNGTFHNVINNMPFSHEKHILWQSDDYNMSYVTEIQKQNRKTLIAPIFNDKNNVVSAFEIRTLMT